MERQVLRKGKKEECTKLLQALAPNADNPVANLFADIGMQLGMVRELKESLYGKKQKHSVDANYKEKVIRDLWAADDALNSLWSGAAMVYPEFVPLFDPMDEFKIIGDKSNAKKKKVKESFKNLRREVYLARMALDAATSLKNDNEQQLVIDNYEARNSDMDKALIDILENHQWDIRGQKTSFFGSQRNELRYFNTAIFMNIWEGINDRTTDDARRQYIRRMFSVLYPQYPLVQSFIRKHNNFA